MSDFTPLWFTVYLPSKADPDPFNEIGLCIGYGDKITPDLTKSECLEEVARILVNYTYGVWGDRDRPRCWRGRSIQILIFGTTFIAKYGCGYEAEYVEQSSSQILWKVADILRDDE